MKIELFAHCMSRDVSPIVHKLERIVGTVLAEHAHSIANFVSIREFLFAMVVLSPSQQPVLKPTSHYYKSEQKYSIDVALEYEDIRSGEWSQCAQALENGLIHAVNKLPKSRISHEERAQLLAFLLDCVRSVTGFDGPSP